MYQNVIVPNEGTREGRIVFAPAADLAWRCGARVVNVSNTDVSDKSSKAVVKQYAISKSAADAEFWVDLEHSLGEATLMAASFRPDPIICAGSGLPVPRLLGSKRPTVSPVVVELVEQADAPVVVIGPRTDTGRGLPMTEVVVVVDGTEQGAGVLGPAAEWARQFKLRMVFTALSDEGPLQERSAAQQYLDAQANAATSAAGVGVELVQGSGGVDDLAVLLAGHEDAVVMIGIGPKGTSMTKNTAALILSSPRAIVLMR